MFKEHEGRDGGASGGGEGDTIPKPVGLAEAAARPNPNGDRTEVGRRSGSVRGYRFTTVTAFLAAAQIDAEQQAKGAAIPLADLLVGVTALELGFSVLTVSLRHFRLIPGLQIVPL